MKKILLTISSCILVAGVSNAQTEKKIIQKGTKFLSGGITFNYSDNSESETFPTFFGNDGNSNERKLTMFNIAPGFGYTITNNLVLGLGTSYTYRESKTNNNDSEMSSISNTYGIGIFARGYKGLTDKLLLFLNGNISYSNTHFNGSDFDSNSYSIIIRPGLAYFISQKLALETSVGQIGYIKSTSEDSDFFVSETDQFFATLNLSNIQFGLSYYF